MTPAQFCSQCGAKLLADANFCVECGAPAPGGKGRVPVGGQPIGRYAPALIVGLVVAIAGGAVAIGLLNPKTPPTVPGRQSNAAPAAAAAPASAPPAGAVPEGHPPVALPDDIKQTMREMAKNAQAEPENMDLWKRLSEAQYRAGQIDPSFLADAEQSLQHVLEREPKNTDVLRNLGNVAFDREQPEKAITYYTKYLELKPEDESVQTDLNTMRLAAGQTDQAIAGYQQILAKNPKFFQAQFNLGFAYFRAGKQAESIAALTKARELAQDDRSRQQVDQVLARIKGGPASATGSAASLPADATATLKDGIEQFFRTHQIIGSKLDRFAWENDHSVKVMLHDFPMNAMPDFVRKQLGERIRGRIKEQKAAHQVTDPVEVQLVDSATGQTMETITE